jgi:hypothetical protein
VPCVELKNTRGVVGPEATCHPDVTSGLRLFGTSGCLDGNLPK